MATVRAKRLTAEQRREAIIVAAREAFLDSGLSGTSLRAIAKRAGITEGLLYHHFSSKDEIFRTAARDEFLIGGWGGTRTKDIAARAGVEESTLYSHFASKAEIFEEAINRPLQAAIDAIPIPSGPPPDAEIELARLGQAMVSIGPLLAVALFGGADRGRALYAERLVPRLTAAVATLSSRPAELVVAALVGLALDAVARPGAIDVDGLARSLAAPSV
jgi:AcrR family transcriptional regulator